jgi:magnesium transporter
MESRAPTDLGIALHQTISAAGTHARRPTFSSPNNGDVRVDAIEQGDVCFPQFEEPGKTSIIDYEELEEFAALQLKANQDARCGQRKQSLSSQGRQPRVFYDMRTQTEKRDLPKILSPTSSPDSWHDFADKGKTLSGETIDEKAAFESTQRPGVPNRFSFFSSECESTIHAAELGDLVLPGERFRDLFHLGPEGGVWWLDVLNPTNDELSAISRAFSIHPLTTEDILTQEAREKVELFKQYYFVCFRTFYQADKLSDRFMEPVHLYMVVFREGVLSFSYDENPHPANVRRRIGKLRDYVSLSSDWICYAMM